MTIRWLFPGLSARAYARILKAARTIAYLAGAENIGAEQISEAINYCNPDSHYPHNKHHQESGRKKSSESACKIHS